MEQKEIHAKLKEISEGLKLFDLTVNMDYKTFEGKLNKRQTAFVSGLLKFFRELKWQIAFNDYKELKYGDKKVINTSGCGTPVKIRSCRKEHGDKTYFGILLGDIAQSISHSIDKDGVVTATHCFHNPAIFIPELNDIVYGCESWWGKIESEEELEKLITDKTIENVWYVKLLREKK